MKDDRKVVYKDGREGTVLCPLDEAYWNERVVLPEQLDVAGILIDTEMYGMKPHAFLEDVCFYDECFHQFIKIIIRKQADTYIRDIVNAKFDQHKQILADEIGIHP